MSTPYLLLEKHPTGTPNPNGIIGDNEDKVDAAFTTATIVKGTTGDPTTTPSGVSLSTGHAGTLCVNLFDKTVRLWNGTVWKSLSISWT